VLGNLAPPLSQLDLTLTTARNAADRRRVSVPERRAAVDAAPLSRTTVPALFLLPAQISYDNSPVSSLHEQRRALIEAAEVELARRPRLDAPATTVLTE
jgi:hypothetical protein